MEIPDAVHRPHPVLPEVNLGRLRARVAEQLVQRVEVAGVLLEVANRVGRPPRVGMASMSSGLGLGGCRIRAIGFSPMISSS
jgi:hypothetical protein